ncbi:MAG: hypothetical protein P1U88_18255, partial [Thalassobaculaceae bacterium]|nr:hypothetical protein [Thalassobaculaceae bacterium]
MILVAALLAGPAAAFEVIKEGGPKARLLFLGLGSSERACGSIDLPEGAVSVVYDPRTFECGAYEQLVVIVRAPFGRGMAFIGELCAAILTRGSRLTLRATGATGHGAPEIVCSLQGPP